MRVTSPVREDERRGEGEAEGGRGAHKVLFLSVFVILIRRKGDGFSLV